MSNKTHQYYLDNKVDERKLFEPDGKCRDCDGDFPEHKPGCKWTDEPAKPVAGLVQVRLEMESMRTQLVRHFHTEFIPQLKASADAAVEDVVVDFPFAHRIQEDARAALTEMVREQVGLVVKSIAEDEKFKAAITEEITAAVNKKRKKIVEAAVERAMNGLDRRW